VSVVCCSSGHLSLHNLKVPKLGEMNSGARGYQLDVKWPFRSGGAILECHDFREENRFIIDSGIQ